MSRENTAAISDFPRTHWSLVARAGQDAAAERREALSRLLGRYRPPLRSHLISRKRLDQDRADDLLQSFITRQVLERELFARADQERGRFRTFLLTALDRFVFNELRDENVRERHVRHCDEQTEDVVAAASEPQDRFDIEWAREVLAEALHRMRQECRGLGKQTTWEVFRARVLRPILTGGEPEPYGQLVERLNFLSPAQASNALITSKRMFVRILRGVVGEYEIEPAQVDAEIADLREILSRGRAGRRAAR